MNDWPDGGTPELVQWGEIDPGSPVRTYFPSIWVDEVGNAVITCARSSPQEFISMSRAVRGAGDPLGEFRPIEFVKQSEVPYTPTRWGDYSGAASDPTQVGFDVNIGGHAAGGPGSYLGTQNFSAAWRGGAKVWDVPGLEKYHGKDVFLTEALTLEANRAVDAAVADGKPFFLYMAHYAVHVPFAADRRFYQKVPRCRTRDRSRTNCLTLCRRLGRALSRGVWSRGRQFFPLLDCGRWCRGGGPGFID